MAAKSLRTPSHSRAVHERTHSLTQREEEPGIVREGGQRQKAEQREAQPARKGRTGRRQDLRKEKNANETCAGFFVPVSSLACAYVLQHCRATEQLLVSRCGRQ